MAKRTKSYGLNNPIQDVFPGPIVATRAFEYLHYFIFKHLRIYDVRL
ncbi:MAG: hypothetical protein K1060chlam2_00591 [Chlamydiae bacterium]|nr:hypothetical protein [Chlamydiota bacterium]